MEGFETEMETSYWLKIKRALRRTDLVKLAAADRILTMLQLQPISDLIGSICM
jgi:hypothetical protein